MNFLDSLSTRGLVHQTSERLSLTTHVDSGPVTVFCGFDATADSLHVGHLITLKTLQRFAKEGHRTIVLVGTGTTRVGDPSFRNSARPMLAPDAIQANAGRLRDQAMAIAGAGTVDPILVDNSDWLGKMGHLDFLEQVGRHFNIARMLSFESVRNRIESGDPLSFMEFGYMLLQATDFLELSRRHGCTIQIGGSDQWGNIVNGIELARKADGMALHAITVPLLVDSSGRKMGKTAGGAVWLSPEKTSAFDFWQFWRNVDDTDVARFLRQLTDIPESRIEDLTSGKGKAINDGKVALADEMTALVHGSPAGGTTATVRATFVDTSDLSGLPQVLLGSGTVTVIEALLAAGFTRSISEGRRLVQQGGVKVDGTTVGNDGEVLDPQATVLSAGKKRRARLVRK